MKINRAGYVALRFLFIGGPAARFAINISSELDKSSAGYVALIFVAGWVHIGLFGSLMYWILGCLIRAACIHIIDMRDHYVEKFAETVACSLISVVFLLGAVFLGFTNYLPYARSFFLGGAVIFALFAWDKVVKLRSISIWRN